MEADSSGAQYLYDQLKQQLQLETAHLATHVMPLDQGPEGYRMFKEKEDGCVRAVFRPAG